MLNTFVRTPFLAVCFVVQSHSKKFNYPFQHKIGRKIFYLGGKNAWIYNSDTNSDILFEYFEKLILIILLLIQRISKKNQIILKSIR